ncbi:MAG: lysophospholipid acyltransferase family protein [Pseudomonadota bacterium]|jgi:KDO2-lipid IV(A) lauroyltransferase
MKYVLETALLWILGHIFRILPYPAALWTGSFLGRVGYSLARRRRKLALENLRESLGSEMSVEELEKTARASFESLGKNAVEFLRLPVINRENIGKYTTVEGEENLSDALAEKKGVLILSAHLGNWDMLSAWLALNGYPLSIISKKSRSEALNRLWMGYREKVGIGILMGRGIMKESIRHLRNGELVGFVLDQNARRSEGVFVPFFGREACTITNLALLARRTGAPVVPLYTYRVGRIHRIVLEKPLPHHQQPDADADILERTRSYAQWTEKVVRLHPDQWTWLHDRWKTRPRRD